MWTHGGEAPGVNLPESVRVVRGNLLSCNQILLSDADSAVLIDAGHLTCADATLTALRRTEHLGARKLTRLILTHAHSDHMGGIATLRRVYGCRVTVPAGEADAISRWDMRALWLDWAGQQCERFAFDTTLGDGEHFEAGGLRWDALAAPGHDAGALMFWCAAERVLISGDALWEDGFGVVLPEPSDAIAAARRTLERIAALDVRLVIPGHGRPFTDVQHALARSFSRLRALADDPLRAVRSVLKAMFAFSLLERGRMPLAQALGWLQEVPLYREYNARYLRQAPDELARWLLADLEKVGALRREGDWLRGGGDAG
jgi:glyoxylase-like metal-dependent hydrolase (beta-lactamase superfamily II)